MDKRSHKPSRAARPIDPHYLDGAPHDLAAAVRMQLREGRKLHPGCQELIGERLGVEPDTIYKITSRLNQVLTTVHVEAVVEATGGRHILAYLHGLAGRVHGAIPEHHFEVLGTLAEIERAVADLNARTVQELRPDDDTPGRLDAAECDELLARGEQVQALLQEQMAQLRVIRQAGRRVG